MSAHAVRLVCGGKNTLIRRREEIVGREVVDKMFDEID